MIDEPFFMILPGSASSTRPHKSSDPFRGYPFGNRNACRPV